MSGHIGLRSNATRAMAARSRWFILLLSLLLLLRSPVVAKEVNDLETAPEPGDTEEPTLEVLRCCRAGEDLDRPGPDGKMRCLPSALPFRPDIYSPTSNDFLESVPSSWRILDDKTPMCDESSALRYIQRSKSNPYIVFDNGNVLTEFDSGVQLSPDEFCFGTSAIMACMPKTEGRPAAATMQPRIRKCCGVNAAYDKKSCVNIDDDVFTSLDNERSILFGSVNSKISANMMLVSGFPGCDNFTILGDIDNVRLQNDASLLVNGNNIPSEEFCIERLRINGKEILPAKVFACTKHASNSEPTKQDIRFTVYPVGFIISSVFLAATLAAGWLLPASHHVLHWRCQTHHVACLMMGDICMAAIQLAGNSLQSEFCRALAILAHFFFLATFFWLNTMCFNIWWTFRDLRPTSLEKNQELKRFRFYASYAWGGSLIIAGLAAILDHLPQSPGQTFIRPHFGETQCWFVGNTEKFTYFFGPIGLLLAVNLIFFAATARELTCGLWKGELVKSTTERAALGKVCLKLVVVMGVPWIFEVMSWCFGGPSILWFVTDVLNALQGVFIFVVVGFQPQVRTTFKRICSRNPRSISKRQGNGLSITSHGIPSCGDSLTQNPSSKAMPLETIC